MTKTTRKASKRQTGLSTFEKIKRALLGISVIGLIGLASDFLGFVSFFNGDEPEVKNQINVNSLDNSLKANTYNYQIINQKNFIEKTTYNNCEIINQSIPVSASASKIDTIKSKISSDNQSDIEQAMNYYCKNEFNLALEYINKYNSAPNNVDLIFFYSLKANIFFFNKDFDKSYQYLLLAFKTDKNSKHLDLPKLRGLIYAYAHLKSNGYTLKELKNIEISKDKKMVIYDLGFKKIEMHNGWILLDKHENNEEFVKLLHELKMLLPQPTSVRL